MVKISKTYVPKLTEKYMCEKHKAYFKKKLTEWKSEIIKANNEALYNGSIDDNSVSADIVDQASSYTDKNVEMKAINRQIKLISKIESALKKNPGRYLWLLRRYRRTNWYKKINGKTNSYLMYCCSRKT